MLPGDDEREERGVLNDDDDDDVDDGGGGGGIAMSLSSSANRSGHDDDVGGDRGSSDVSGNDNDHHADEREEANEGEEEEEEVGCWILCGRVIWRILPDVLTILLIICLSPLLITDKEIQGWLWFVAIPFLFLAIVTVSMSQQDVARINLTRYFYGLFFCMIRLLSYHLLA